MKIIKIDEEIQDDFNKYLEDEYFLYEIHGVEFDEDEGKIKISFYEDGYRYSHFYDIGATITIAELISENGDDYIKFHDVKLSVENEVCLFHSENLHVVGDDIEMYFLEF